MSGSPDYVVLCVLARLAEMSWRQVSAASTYVVWMPLLQHPRGWLDMWYLAHPFDGMCNVIVPLCFPLCYIGTLCGLANSQICQHPLCCYIVLRFLSLSAWRLDGLTARRFTWIDNPRNIVDYVDRRSTDYFVYLDRQSTDYFVYLDRWSTNYFVYLDILLTWIDDPWNFVDYVDRRSTEYCWSLLNIDSNCV